MRSMFSSNNFFRFLDAHVDGGLANVWVSLTGDHGVATSPADAAKEGMPAAVFPYGAMNAELNKELDAKLTPGKQTRFVLGGELPFVQIDSDSFAAAKMNEARGGVDGCWDGSRCAGSGTEGAVCDSGQSRTASGDGATCVYEGADGGGRSSAY